MDKLHITQDEHGYWMLSLEKEDGTLALIAHQFETADKPIEVANEMIREQKVTATVIVDPPRPKRRSAADAAPDVYAKPAPKKAGA
jgi:hypothetical protein